MATLEDNTNRIRLDIRPLRREQPGSCWIVYEVQVNGEVVGTDTLMVDPETINEVAWLAAVLKNAARLTERELALPNGGTVATWVGYQAHCRDWLQVWLCPRLGSEGIVEEIRLFVEKPDEQWAYRGFHLNCAPTAVATFAQQMLDDLAEFERRHFMQ